MPVIPRRVLSTMRDERGMTMLAAMGMLTAALLIFLASVTAIKGDLPLARADQDRKEAYAAAEAGINYYSYHLAQDNTYWLSCNSVPDPDGAGPDPNPVVDAWSGTGADTRTGHWRKIPGSNAEYAIEVLPAPGYTACQEGIEASVLDPANGTFKVRSTGRDGSAKRSLVATYKRRGFLDYLYFTDYETLDPLAYDDEDEQEDAADDCVIYHYQGRDDDDCTEIRFISGDEVAGPLHTNDSILVCGDPTFGRTSADSIESAAPSPGYWDQGSCDADPNFVGTWKPGSLNLSMPLTNSALSTVASATYRFTGKTTIVLSATGISVTNNNTTQNLAYPPNGVIYVQNGTCGVGYSRQQTYNNPTGCGDVHVNGTYPSDLTIGAANDIIIKGDIIGTNNAMLGLIPNNFARIYHPVSFSSGGCTNQTGTMMNVRVDAAILALNHSFIVDNWYCGADLDTLTVNGAIAQKFRGPVGTGGGSGGSGYIKDYNYDDDLQHRDPPYFLSPTQAAWTIRRQVEQSPAR